MFKQLRKKVQKAIAIMNWGSKDIVFSLTPEKAGIKKHNKLRDLWLHKSIDIPARGIVVLKIY
ncbi:hypothetical protein [Niabella aquatica]